MSLLNDMLRDLSDRRREGGASIPSAEAAPTQRRFMQRRLLVAVGALGLLALIIGGLWHYQQPPRQTGDLQAAVKEIRIPVVRVPEIEPLVVPERSEPPQESSSVSAPSGVETVAVAVVESLPTELVRDSSGGEPDVQSAAAPEVEAPDVEPSVTKPRGAQAQAANAQSNQPGQPAVVRSEPQLPAEQIAYQRGLKELQQGDTGSAVTYLQEALHIKPDFLSARLRLVSLLQQTAPDAVADLLREGLEYQPQQPLLRKLYAQELSRQQRLEEAVVLLERTPLPAVEEDPEYHALLAALLQETRSFESAAQVYSRLLQYRPQEALWWLGLAISLEQQGAIAQAKEAYQSALAVAGLRPDLERYVRSRLQVL